MSNLDVKYTVSSKVIMSSVGDEAVLLDPVKGSYYGVNEVGLFILSQLRLSSKTIQELVGLIQLEYDVEEEECTKDVKELIADLLKVEVIATVN